MSDLPAPAVPARRHRARRAKPRTAAAIDEAQLWALAMLPLLTVGVASLAAWITWGLAATSAARTWTVFAVVALVSGAATMVAVVHVKAAGRSLKQGEVQVRGASEHVQRVEHWIYADLWPRLREGRQTLHVPQDTLAELSGQHSTAGNSRNPYREFSAALQGLVDDADDAVSERAAVEDQQQMTMYVTKRLHTTVRQALKLLYELTKKIEDPAILDITFAIDQHVTQLRRSIESLAIIAGERPRRQDKTSLVSTVLRSAAQEIKDGGRVRRVPIKDCAILGYAVPDLAHMLAELMENAVRYSPPKQDVVVKPSHVPGGLAIEIDDIGLPMSEEKLESLNRLIDPREADVPEDRKRTGLGMRVVAEIAARYDVTVHLGRNLKGGNQALVVVPTKLLAAPPDPNGEAAVHPAEPLPVEAQAAPTPTTAPATVPVSTVAPAPWPAGSPAQPAFRTPDPRGPLPHRASIGPADGGGRTKQPLPKRSESPDRGHFPRSDIDSAGPPPAAENPGQVAAQFARGRQVAAQQDTHPQHTTKEDRS